MNKHSNDYFGILLLILLLGACRSEPKFIQFSGETMGTTYYVAYKDWSGRDFQPQIDSILWAMNQSLSTFIDTSVISRINKPGASLIPVDKYFVRVFRRAKRVHKKTNGAFDPTVLPLVEAWGFGSGESLQMDSTSVDSLRALIGFNAFELVPDLGKVFGQKPKSNIVNPSLWKVRKMKPNAQLDFSALAKGYAADVLGHFLIAQKIENYLVEIGGEIKVKGLNEKGQKWKVGIDKPREGLVAERELQIILAISHWAIATSGNYRNFREMDGRKVVHTINPGTGYPEISSLLSASVAAPTCITADAYATAFMVMGWEDALKFAENDPVLEAYFIYGDAEGKMQIVQTSGWGTLLASEQAN